MEPPTKRPRLGPAHLDNHDDPEADELNERPEDVNARRDPAVQLERSRAFAAFKLKSAFERIFEKYEKDFTGVSDEIDLRTGEIVVDNGHVHSLVGAQLGGAEDGEGEGSEDGVSEAGSLNEEERMMRGQVDNRLSRVGQNALPSIPPQIGPAPPFLAGGWSGPPPMMGGSPGFPGMMYPGQVDYGGFPMQYGTPISMPTTDPAWSTPALPPPFVRNALTLGEATASVKRKAARLSLSAAREQDGRDEDDIFLDVSAVAKDGGRPEGLVMKQKVLLAHPPPEKASAKKKKKPPVKESKKAHQAGRLGRPPKAKQPPVDKKSLKSTPTAQPDPTPDGTSTAPGPKSVALINGRVADTTSTPTRTNELAATSLLVPRETAKEVHQEDPKTSEPVPGESGESVYLETSPELDREHPDVYVNLSDEGEILARIPRNQIFRVEIPARKPPDAGSFRIITPEPSGASSPKPQEAVMEEACPKQAATVSKAQAMDMDTASGSGNQAKEVSVETFSRNHVDPAYAFSDEDEPTLPRRRKVQRKPSKPKPVRPINTEPAVLREISQNLSSGMASGRELGPNTPAKEVAESATARAPSPTLSLHLDDVQVHHGSGLLRSLGGGGGTDTLPEPSVAENPDRIGDKEAVASGQTAERRITRRMSMHNAGNSPFVLPEPEAASRKTNRRRRSSKIQPIGTPSRTPGNLEIRGIRSLAPPRRHEIPETSPNAQPAVSPLTASSPPAPTPEIRDSESPFSPEEQAQDVSDHQDVSEQPDRAPSPTLTDPSSKPQTTMPRPRSAPKKTTTTTPHIPRTPTKTPTRRQPKAHHRPQQQPPPPSTNPLPPPPPTTTSTTTPKRKTKGLLSLLLTNPDAPSSSEDELSILTPAKRPPSTTIRSTPASHHVRLGLLSTATGGDTGTSSSSTATTKLKRALLSGSVGKGKGKGKGKPSPGGGAVVQTPTGGSRGRRKSAVGVGGSTGPPPRTPSSRMALLQESELVQTPGGTMRRCGESGFRCEREFCFSCL